jgi:endonuclease YncB( thermonuclease family)
VGLSDGDTVTVLDGNHRQYKVRLAGIDAPERRQPFGDRSRQALAAMVFRQHVAVEWHKTDRYGRLVGVVRISGRDVGLEQVKSGLAWHYKAYQSEQTKADRMLYDQAEEQARVARRGLWRDPLPEAPWEFRQRGRLR